MSSTPDELVAKVVVETANGLINTTANLFNHLAAEFRKPGPAAVRARTADHSL